MSLKEQAFEAADDQRKKMLETAKAEREKSLDELIEKWDERCKWTFRDAIPQCPARDEFTYARDVPHDGHRGSPFSGWKVVIDEIEFLYSTTYGDTGWKVMVTCPDCKSTRAVNFSGLEGLGRVLKAGRDLFHHCYELEAKRLAVAIGAASRDAATSPQQIIDRALEHYDIIARQLR